MAAPSNDRIAVLGVGKMGETLLAGMLRGGMPADRLLVSEKRADHAKVLRERYAVEIADNVGAVDKAGTLLVVVKPQDIAALLEEIAPHVTENHLVVSVAAGIPTSFIEDRLGTSLPVVRVMSNTPALVDEAMSALSAGRHAGEEHLARAEALLAPVGRTVRVPESQQDAVTALSGSGPAYVFYLVEAMTEAGILLGLPRATAHDLVVQAVLGAAVMLRETGEHPVALREAVTSPGGTTIAAIRELENHGVRAALLAAIEAACARSRELAAGA